MRLRPRLALFLLVACGPKTPPADTEGATGAGTSSSSGPDTTGAPTTSGPAEPPTGSSSDTGDEPDAPPLCETLDTCDQAEVLIVIDNSVTMAEEQQRLAQAAPEWIAALREIRNNDGELLDLDFNLMVTTTDISHPLCAPFQPNDYAPAFGAPIGSACTSRLSHFTSIDAKLSAQEACTSVCSPEAPAAPADPFLHFTPDEHNVVGGDGDGDVDPVAAALACMIPQGINGCGMESPLEAMRLALAPDAPWNLGDAPFLRPGSRKLLIVLVTDETDCSALNHDYFDPSMQDPEHQQYWEIDPKTGNFNMPTSAVCWNGGMTCAGPDADGVYASCTPEDKGVLQPIDRYADFLRELRETQQREVSMIVIGGVPLVKSHNPDPPYEPAKGGLEDLVFRTWQEADVPPDSQETPATMEYQFGIGPGCVGTGGAALPPGRLASVCQSLDQVIGSGDDTFTRLRCCVESICDETLNETSCVHGLMADPGSPFYPPGALTVGPPVRGRSGR